MKLVRRVKKGYVRDLEIFVFMRSVIVMFVILYTLYDGCDGKTVVTWCVTIDCRIYHKIALFLV